MFHFLPAREGRVVLAVLAAVLAVIPAQAGIQGTLTWQLRLAQSEKRRCPSRLQPFCYFSTACCDPTQSVFPLQLNSLADMTGALQLISTA